MSTPRVGWVVAAVLIGTVAAIVGNWWTVGGMICLVIAQVEAERRDRAAREPAGDRAQRWWSSRADRR